MSLSTLLKLAGIIVGQTAMEGRRVAIGDEANLFIPQGYQPREGRLVDVVLQLHGAASVVEPALVEAKWPAVLIEFNRKGLSSVYTKPFSDPALFPRLLASANKAVKDAGLANEPQTGRVVVSSFSAGDAEESRIIREDRRARHA